MSRHEFQVRLLGGENGWRSRHGLLVGGTTQKFPSESKATHCCVERST